MVPKQLIQKFQLDKSQLAFTYCTLASDNATFIPEWNTTVYSTVLTGTWSRRIPVVIPILICRSISRSVSKQNSIVSKLCSNISSEHSRRRRWTTTAAAAVWSTDDHAKTKAHWYEPPPNGQQSTSIIGKHWSACFQCCFFLSFRNNEVFLTKLAIDIHYTDIYSSYSRNSTQDYVASTLLQVDVTCDYSIMLLKIKSPETWKYC